MRSILSITIVLLFVGVLAVGPEVDGGLFRRSKCGPGGCKPSVVEPAPVPFPIDELKMDPLPSAPEIPVSPATCEVDIDAIVAEVLRRLPPVMFEIQHPDGKVFSQSKPLGKPIRLRLVPQ